MKKVKAYFSRKSGKRLSIFTMIAMLFAIAAPEMALAAMATSDQSPTQGNQDDTFGSAIIIITAWLKGSLGKLTALVLLTVGLIMGVMRQSIAACVPAVAAALAMYMGPIVIESVFSAALPFAPVVG